MKDDPVQLEKVIGALAEGVFVVQTTVLLETEWVLRGVYGYGRSDIATALADLLSLPDIHFVEEARIMAAVSMHTRGMDFADALHLAGDHHADAFLTFDRHLAKRALRNGSTVPVRLL
ncbi:type II toxin-antitoxin system VapC family toxin [Aurantimonas sp. Leaf443]|uniref:type II toxin-antitoxin system VapC family toxin n=1 Tax=Aurantimonas sp. Leaf443 TaxID=1736378 RepID=UPI00138F76C7|nr:type II toxin-antitoxin system VapC family toxin [Aurantimonas sp. Leaf443]